jgi:hypothetical protein
MKLNFILHTSKQISSICYKLYYYAYLYLFRAFGVNISSFVCYHFRFDSGFVYNGNTFQISIKQLFHLDILPRDPLFLICISRTASIKCRVAAEKNVTLTSYHFFRDHSFQYIKSLRLNIV